MAKDRDLTTGNLFPKILIFTIPVMLSSMLQLLFNAVDLIVVGQFAGQESLAAVGSTSSLINLITNIFIGVSLGANVVLATAIGRRDLDSARRTVHTAIAFALTCGLALSIFGIFTSRIWLELMGTNKDSLDKATIYLQIYFAGSIFNMVYNFGASLLRAVGETKRPLYYLTAAGIINALLNILFVTAFKWDVVGVAVATIAAQGVSAILVLIYLYKSKGYTEFRFKELRFHGKELGKMIYIGIPASIQSSLISLSNVFIQSAVNSFDSNAIVAGNTASANIEGFVWTAMNSFYQACLTFTSQNRGANKLGNCKKVLFYCILLTTLTGIILGGFVYLIRYPLLDIYTDGEAMEYGAIRLTIICLTYALCGIMDIPVGGLRGLGHSVPPMIVSILGMVVFRIIWLSTVFQANHELWVIYISYPISWVATATVHYICYFLVYRKEKIKLETIIESQTSNMEV